MASRTGILGWAASTRTARTGPRVGTDGHGRHRLHRQGLGCQSVPCLPASALSTMSALSQNRPARPPVILSSGHGALLGRTCRTRQTGRTGRTLCTGFVDEADVMAPAGRRFLDGIDLIDRSDQAGLTGLTLLTSLTPAGLAPSWSDVRRRTLILNSSFLIFNS